MSHRGAAAMRFDPPLRGLQEAGEAGRGVKNLPAGLRAEDNQAGSRLSLEQVARRLE